MLEMKHVQNVLMSNLTVLADNWVLSVSIVVNVPQDGCKQQVHVWNVPLPLIHNFGAIGLMQTVGALQHVQFAQTMVKEIVHVIVNLEVLGPAITINVNNALM